MTTSGKMALVTFLTFVRVPLVILFLIAAVINSVSDDPSAALFYASFVCLALAAITDAVDGYLARKLEVTSSFGAYADPLTDKVFYLTTLPVLVFLSAANDHTVHAIVLLCFTVLFMFRDQWVSFLRSVGSIYGASASANWSGKWRTGISFPVICVVYYYEAAPIQFFGGSVLYTLEAAGIIINLISIWVYTANYWPYVLKSIRPDKKK